jgi:hypothetical protein
MAHIEDRWEKTVDGDRIRTPRHGQGMRWRARYLDPDGHQRSKMFARKVDAERFLASVTTDMLRGAYVDPSAGKVTFADFAARWLEARTFGESSREATEVRLRVHAYPYLGAASSATCVPRSSRPGCAGCRSSWRRRTCG